MIVAVLLVVGVAVGVALNRKRIFVRGGLDPGLGKSLKCMVTQDKIIFGRSHLQKTGI